MAASLAHLAMALQGALTTTARGQASPLASPGSPGLGSASDAAAWRQLAPALGQPQLLLLAIAEELRPLAASLHSLNLIQATVPASAPLRVTSAPRHPQGPSRRLWLAPAQPAGEGALGQPMEPPQPPSQQPPSPQPGPQQPGPPTPC